MVKKLKGASVPIEDIPNGEITVAELISRLQPKLEDAHKRGWESWPCHGDNGRPSNYDAKLSESDLLWVFNWLTKLQGEIISFRHPEYTKKQESALQHTQKVTRDWLLRSSEVEEISRRLEPLFELGGRNDAAAQWKGNEGRLTPAEAVQQLKVPKENEAALVARLVNDARSGEIPAYAPGQRIRNAYVPDDSTLSPASFTDEFYPSDLNDWLERKEPRNTHRFDVPKDDELRKLTVLGDHPSPASEIVASMVTAGRSQSADANPGEQFKITPQLRDMMEAYNKLRTGTGKSPSKTAVSKESGYDRETVAKRWDWLLECCQNKSVVLKPAKTNRNQHR